MVLQVVCAEVNFLFEQKIEWPALFGALPSVRVRLSIVDFSSAINIKRPLPKTTGLHALRVRQIIVQYFISTPRLTMADIFLIVMMVVAFAILFIAGLYLLVNYQHPDDSNDAYFPKLVVIFGFVLSGFTVLLLPLDVANNEGYAGT
jgi:hypothetical protein